ncbi:MAG: riboflavin kinase [Candidatus Staskawiczbacteria bacterium]|jgi:riboflavin kinase/FMN adenylyltransferase
MNITGLVIRGAQKGRILGFPTANIKVNIKLESGIYAGRVIINNKKYGCALYCAGDKIIEAFIFDFAENLYGKNVEVKIMNKIRDKKIFKSNTEAKEQIAEDVLLAKKFLLKK